MRGSKTTPALADKKARAFRDPAMKSISRIHQMSHPTLHFRLISQLHTLATMAAVMVGFVVGYVWATPLVGQDRQWINEAGGDFHEAANWDAGVPGASENAVFGLNAVYGVALTADADVQAWRQSSGDVSLFGGHTLQSGGSSINSSSLSINGLGTRFLNSGQLALGTLQSAALNIHSGTKVTSSTAVLGNAGTSFGAAIVSGAGANWSTSGSFSIDLGSLAIEEGGFVSTGLATVGSQDGSGLVTVSGTDSHWQMSSVSIGASGSGELRIENGGQVTGTGFVGRAGVGSATVSGAGSRWDNNVGEIRVGGLGGTGTFTIENGGQVVGRAGAIASESGSRGDATVRGPGSSWVTSLQMAVGSAGDGTLTIEQGGYVSNSSGTLAATNQGHATVTVTGPGSHWNLAARLSLSSFGSGTLNINDGGLVTVGENVESPFTSIGSNSKVNLDGGRFEFGITSFDSLSRICGTRGSLAGMTESISGYRQISSLEIGNLSSLDTTDVRVANAGVILGTGVTNLGLENDTDGELRARATDFMKIEGHSFNSGEINNFGGVIEFENSLTNRADGFIGGRGQFSTDGGLINEGVMAFTAGPTEISGDVEILAGGRVITSGESVTTFFNDVAHNGQEIRTAAGSRTKFLGEVSGAGAFTGTGELLIMGDLRRETVPE